MKIGSSEAFLVLIIMVGDHPVDVGVCSLRYSEPQKRRVEAQSVCQIPTKCGIVKVVEIQFFQLTFSVSVAPPAVV